jgi:glyoxylase-like metal-dependent hydrolase (beta-lactamase superfamily II)
VEIVSDLDDLLQPIAPGLYLLPSESGGKFPESHCFVVRGEQEVLIDAGCGQQRLRAVLERWSPDTVIISHSHPDHVSGLWQVDRDACKVFSPVQSGADFWRLGPLSVRFVGPELAPVWIAYITRFTGVRETTSDARFDHGHRFDLGRVHLEAVHTPGHLDDHYILFEPVHGVALTFDIDLTPFGPWYGHPESDIERTLASIQRVAALEPRVLVSSHRGIFSGREQIQEQLRAYARIVDRRDRRILELLERPRTVDELVDESPIYRGHSYAPEILRYWEGSMIEKHLARMRDRGQVQLEQEPEQGRWRRA